MLFKDYLAAMNELAKNNPESLEMPCIYSSDDEGNSYQEVYYEPEISTYNSVGGREFEMVSQEDIDNGEYDEVYVANFVKGVTIN